MKNRRLLFTVLALVLALALGLGWSARPGVQAANQELGSGPRGLAALRSGPAADAGTAFTYQGYLESSGDAVTGSCDFRFILYDSKLGGSQIGPLQSVPNVEVNNGVFTADVDFGASAFTGEERWLEISVRCAGDAGYTNLGRQVVTAAPHALSAPWAGLSGVPAGFADGIDDEATIVEGTQVYAGEGLVRLTGTESVTLSVASTYRLPQACDNGQIAEWSGSVWECGDDDVGTGNGAGDITAVYAGDGLTGGGTSNDVTLEADFAGSGVDTTVARSDHNHDATYVNEGQADSVSSAMLEDGATLDEILDDDGDGSGLDADQLDGQHGAYYRNADNINAGTLGTDRFSAHDDLSADGYLGNASGDLAQNNGSLQTNLNADRLDGQHAADFAGASHSHWGASWSGSDFGLSLDSTDSTALFASAGTGSPAIVGTSTSDLVIVFGAIGVAGVGDEVGVLGGGPTGVLGNGENEAGVRGWATTGIGVKGVDGGDATDNSYGVYSEGDIRTTDDLYVDDQLLVTGYAVFSGGKTGYVVDIAQNDDSATLQPGDVVVISGAGPAVLGEIPVVKVRLAREAETSGVVGVVDEHYVPAAKPAVQGTGNETKDESVMDDAPIAPSEYLTVVTLGAFKAIKVDASYGAVAPGDLLVASPNPGYAMRTSSPKPGTIIGKALGGLDSGTGVIAVLVTLH